MTFWKTTTVKCRLVFTIFNRTVVLFLKFCFIYFLIIGIYLINVIKIKLPDWVKWIVVVWFVLRCRITNSSSTWSHVKIKLASPHISALARTIAFLTRFTNGIASHNWNRYDLLSFRHCTEFSEIFIVVPIPAEISFSRHENVGKWPCSQER